MAAMNSSVLLTRFNGANGSTSFVDEMGKAWTAVSGSAMSTAISNPYGASGVMYFDGSGQYITTPTSSDFDFGTGDFSIEFWVYPTTSNLYRRVINRDYWTGSRWYFNNIAINSDNKVFFEIGNDWTGGVTAYNVVSSSTISTNTWSHISCVRSGTSLLIFINGVLDSNVGSIGSSIPAGGYPAPLTIGNRNLSDGQTAGSAPFTGYISDLHIIKGYAKYTSNFSVPASYVPKYAQGAAQNVVSMLHFDGADGSSSISDDAGIDWTNVGVLLDKSRSLFGETTARFNGSSYIQTASNANLAFGAGDFTVEMWVRLDSTESTQILFDLRNNDYQVAPVIYMSANQPRLFVNGADVLFSSLTVSALSVFHLAVSRYRGTTKMFINGSQVGSVADPNNYAQYGCVIGASGGILGSSGTVSLTLTGNVKDVCVIKGFAKYTSAFTIHSAIIPSQVLALHADDYVDQSSKSITNNNVTINTSNPKYGTGAFSFNGTNSYLGVPAGSDFSFGTGDFTIQSWVYIKSDSALNSSNARSCTIFSILNWTQDVLLFYVNGNSSTTGTGLNIWDGVNSYGTGGAASISKNAWHHCAVTRKSGVIKFWLDGSMIGSGSYTQSSGGAYPACVGGRNIDGYPMYLNGLMDDIQVHNGVAIYDEEFTPPNRPFSNRNDVLYGVYRHVANSTDYLEPAQQSLSPVALYKLGNIVNTTTSYDGMVATDTSGNNRHATIYGDIVPATHLGMQCAYFNGNFGYIYSPSISALNDLTDGYTVEFCFDPDEKVNYDAILSIGQQTENASNNDDIYVAKTGNSLSYGDGLDFIRGISSSWSGVTAKNCFRNNDGWKHVIMAHDSSGRMRIYINGCIVANKDVSLPSISSSRNRIIIGKRSADSHSYDYQGYISNVAVYNYALSESQIQSNFAEFIKTFILASVTETLGISSNTLYVSMFDGQASSSATYNTALDANGVYNITGSDSASATDSADYIFRAVNVITDTINEAILALSSTDKVYVQFASADDSITIQASYSAVTGWAVSAVSSMTASDNLPNTPVIYGGIATDTLNAVSQLMVTLPAFTSDSIICSAEGEGFLLILKTIIDTLSVSSSASVDRAVLAAIGDDINVSETYSTQALLQAVLKDQLVISVKGKQGDQLWTGYCLNKNIGATSIYENFKFNSYAKLNGKYYGCAKDGIYELDMSDADNGSQINAMFTTGLVDCGNSLKKSVDNAFLAVRSDGDVFLRVRADGEEFTYRLSKDNIGKFEGARVKIGKGLRAVNWQFELYNSNGSDFDIDSMKIYPLLLTRHGGGGAR